MKAYLNAISYYLPENALSNKDIAMRFPEWSIDKIALKTGIISRRIAKSDEFASDLAIKSAEKLFDEHKIEKESIDFLLYCTQSPDYLLPTTACILQKELDLPNRIGAVDINLGCSGYVYSLSIAKALVSSGICRNVLLITSDTYSKYINERDKSNITIFGDGSSASLISSDKKGLEIGNFVFGTDGGGAQNLIFKNSGVHGTKEGLHKSNQEPLDFYNQDDFLYMNGSEIFNFTVSAVPKLVDSTLSSNELMLDDINFFVFHQANKYMLEFIRRKIGIPNEKFYTHLEECGNTVSSTIPIALSELWKKNNLKENRVLLAGFGVGYSWAGCILNP